MGLWKCNAQQKNLKRRQLYASGDKIDGTESGDTSALKNLSFYDNCEKWLEFSQRRLRQQSWSEPKTIIFFQQMIDLETELNSPLLLKRGASVSFNWDFYDKLAVLY